MQDSVAAKTYARALFQQSQAANQLLACQQGLDQITMVAKQKKSVRDVLKHPAVLADEKKTLVHSALGEFATPLLERFLALLVRKHRFDLLPLIRQEFQEEVDRFQNVEAVKVRSALALSEAQTKALRARLEKWLGATVRMEVQVDDSLIGGLTIQTRSVMVDESLKGRLRRLQQQLVG